MFFSYLVVWAFPLFSPVGCEPYVACRTFRSLYIQVTSFLMNALVHFVHRSLPLFLFLTDIPHGKDINHFNLPPFSVLSPTSRRWECLARWSISFVVSFTLRSYAYHTVFLLILFLPAFFRKRLFCLFAFFKNERLLFG